MHQVKNKPAEIVSAKIVVHLPHALFAAARADLEDNQLNIEAASNAQALRGVLKARCFARRNPVHELEGDEPF